MRAEIALFNYAFPMGIAVFHRIVMRHLFWRVRRFGPVEITGGVRALGDAISAPDASILIHDDDAVGALTSMMEPLLMVFLGTTVGGLVIAMYLPIFKLAGAVGGG